VGSVDGVKAQPGVLAAGGTANKDLSRYWRESGAVFVPRITDVQ